MRPRDLEAREPRHADVEERDVGLVVVDRAQRLEAVGGERQHLELRPERGEARAQVLGEVRLVVGDERARLMPGIAQRHARARGRGSRAMASEARSP